MLCDRLPKQFHQKRCTEWTFFTPIPESTILSHNTPSGEQNTGIGVWASIPASWQN